jgi:hypothetical protein
MARLPLPPGQKKEGIALDFSPLLIGAIDALRGSKSRSVYVEEWLRERPEIASWLSGHQDAGFHPPVSRYEQLVDLLMVFYRARQYPSEIQQVLKIAHDCIMRNLGSEEDVIADIVGGLRSMWAVAPYGQSKAICSAENALPAIQAYAEFYYRAIFLKMADGERALLQSRFRGVARGCEAVYKARLQQINGEEGE